MKITLNYHKSAWDEFFLGIQERVRNSRGKRAISVRAIEVLLCLLKSNCILKDSVHVGWLFPSSASETGIISERRANTRTVSGKTHYPITYVWRGIHFARGPINIRKNKLTVYIYIRFDQNFDKKFLHKG